MKHNFTSRKIIGSLFFPILICLIFGTSFVIFSIGKELNALRLGCLFSALLGGFLAIVITLWRIYLCFLFARLYFENEL